MHLGGAFVLLVIICLEIDWGMLLFCRFPFAIVSPPGYPLGIPFYCAVLESLVLFLFPEDIDEPEDSHKGNSGGDNHLVLTHKGFHVI